MGGGACVCGGGVPLAFFNISGARFCSESHLYISKTKKTLLSLGVTQQVSAASFLSHKFTHQSEDPVLCFLSTLCLSAFSVHPRQVDARQLAEVERRFCLSV